MSRRNFDRLPADSKCGPEGKTGVTNARLTHVDVHAVLIYTLHRVVMQVMDIPYRLEKRRCNQGFGIVMVCDVLLFPLTER